MSRAGGFAGRLVPGAALLSLALVVSMTLPGCPGPDEPERPDQVGAPAPEGGARPSTAADDAIARADSDDEREALRAARDEIDAEGRREAAARDAEIERLRRENAELERALPEGGTRR